MTSKKNPKQGKKRGRKPTGKGRYGVLSCRVSTEEKAAFELLALTRHKCSPAALLGQLARAAMDSKSSEVRVPKGWEGLSYPGGKRPEGDHPGATLEQFNAFVEALPEEEKATLRRLVGPPEYEPLDPEEQKIADHALEHAGTPECVLGAILDAFPEGGEVSHAEVAHAIDPAELTEAGREWLRGFRGRVDREMAPPGEHAAPVPIDPLDGKDPRLLFTRAGADLKRKVQEIDERNAKFSRVILPGESQAPELVKDLEAVTFTEDDLVDSDDEPPAPPDTRDTIDSLEDLE